MTTLIHEGTIHYWEKELMQEYRLEVPIYENFLLHFAHENEIYLFCNPEKAIERGAMICTQTAVVLMQLMERLNYEAHQYALDGHTVALIQIDPEKDVWWFADADFGVVIPVDYREVQANPELIIPYYSEAGYEDEPYLLDNLVSIYGPEGNYSQGQIAEFSYCEREELSYWLKWAIPAAAILQFPMIVGGTRSLRKVIGDQTN